MADRDILSRILPDCYIYISHLDEEYKYWQLPGYPDQITDSMDSNFSPSTALGRSAPVYTFSSAGPRSINISLEFHRDMFDEMPSNVVPKDDEDKSESFIHAIQAIAVPKYNLSNKAIEPPLVAIRLGKEVFIKGIGMSRKEKSLPPCGGGVRRAEGVSSEHNNPLSHRRWRRQLLRKGEAKAPVTADSCL